MAFLRDMGWSASATIFVAVGRFAAMTLIARNLGVEDFGTIAFSVFAIELLVLVCMFGLPGVLSRFRAIAIGTDDAALSRFNRMGIGWGLISLAVILCVSPLVAIFLVGLDALDAGLFCAWALAAALGATGVAFMQGSFRYDLVSVGSALSGAVFVALAYVLVRPGAIDMALVTLALAALASGLPAMLVRGRLEPGAGQGASPLPSPREILAYGGNVWITGITGVLLWSRGEMLALRTLTDERALGLYGAAITISALVWRATSLFQGAVGPHLSRHVASGDAARLHDFVTTMSRFTLGISALAAMGLALFGQELTALVFGPDFREAGALTIILAPGAAMAGIGTANLTAQYLSNGRFSRNAQIVGALALGLCAAVFLSLFGLPGAAISRVLVLTGIAVAVVAWLWAANGAEMGRRLAGDLVLIICGISFLSMINLVVSPHWAFRGLIFATCSYGGLMWISGTAVPWLMIPRTLSRIRAL